MATVTLKPGKETPLRAGHPWIFSEALSTTDAIQPGDLVTVNSPRGEALGIGYINPNTSIRVRMLTHNPKEVIDVAFFAKRFKNLDEWKRPRLPANTNGYRLVHSESDNLPGLIIDRYADVFVFQLHTYGMERLRDQIIAALKETFSPRAIVERSDVDVRRMEGLKDLPKGIRDGSIEGPVSFQECGITFLADVLNGQKTGFFLDQREARRSVGRHGKGKHVLNLFGYTGAFSLHAAQGGAKKITTVDISNAALANAMEQFRANDLNPDDDARFEFLEADVMDLLADPAAFTKDVDLIVCDPPAFAKTSSQLPQAIKAYTDLNTSCLKRLQVGGILVSSSCSGRLDSESFRNLLRIASGRAGRDVRLLEWITQPIDHAERLAFSEGRYLKTAVLEVTGIL